MPILTVLKETGDVRIDFLPGTSLLNILNTGDMRVRSGCAGSGGCGLCRIRIETGKIHELTATERQKLSDDQVLCGIRLACQVMPQTDLRIRILNLAPTILWRNIQPEEYLAIGPSPSVRSETYEGKQLGAAVDLGTTHIRLTIWDMKTGLRLAGRSGLNPQSRFGTDVLTRITAASESQECLAAIGQLAQNAIGEALRDMALEMDLNIREIGHVVIVGNTAMLALLTGINDAALLKPGHRPGRLDYHPDAAGHWRRSWGLEADAIIEVIQPLGGFVGSDLLAGLLATHLAEGPAGSLLIDFGTNSEISLWDGNALWTTSAAGGPAFEGSGIHCGMPAEPGAIYRFEPNKTSDGFRFDVEGGGEPKGICGSGLTDIIAELIRAGMLKRNGRFTQQFGGNEFFLIAGEREISVTKRDVDVFQRAKAAIGAGIACLLQKAGVRLQNLQRICICGAFGRFLNVSNAMEVGLLPFISSECVELAGNTALAGCELLLFDPDRVRNMERLKSKCRLISLSEVPEFEDLFIRNLQLVPMK
ncbi:MAG: DUF4445 domain-containing protein [Deltaproteobacteria bacterium]|nr:DUF4445 domain-containing protein [Deltaproteobacteria bacterium]